LKGRALVVHNNRKVYVIEALDNNYEIERELNKFAALIKVPEGIHTYELDEYSLWSAAALGLKSDYIINFLEVNSRHMISDSIKDYIQDKIKEFWTVKLVYSTGDIVILHASDMRLVTILLAKVREVKAKEEISDKLALEKQENLRLLIRCKDTYFLKELLLAQNIFIDESLDDLGNSDLKVTTDLYDYQKAAVESFILNHDGVVKGRGVISMPPGSGKTLVGLKIIEVLKVKTLVLVENKHSFESWIEAMKEHTSLGEKAEYSIRYNELDDKVSIITYLEAQKILSNMLSVQWGLIIYDDAHKLPSPKSKILAYLISKYKLALGSILKREDNNQYIIYKAVGPKIYNLTLREMELKGIQIRVECCEVKIPQHYWEEVDMQHGKKFLREAKNQNKIDVYKRLNERHRNGKIVLVSTFNDIGDKFNENIGDAIIIDGRIKDPRVRRELTEEFNKKNVGRLIVSELLEKLQLSDIDVLISLSYIGESEREEYLRIGKLKSSNPYKKKIGYYYALVSENTCEDEAYKKRSQDMVKYGYRFKIIYYIGASRGIIDNEA
jgi:DNA excision repair protein ERCC-3